MLAVAERLASFRLGLDSDDPYAFNENEKLMAGIIVGSLWAQGFLTERINGEASELHDDRQAPTQILWFGKPAMPELRAQPGCHAPEDTADN